jgi:protein involved in polysaccharide export with SLBB domain
MSIFQRTSNEFEPSTAGPVDANYRLGALDVVAVILTGQVELAHTLEVTRDGFIVIPQVGQVFVANLTVEQATKVVVQKLRASYRGVGTEADALTKVYVGVARLRTIQVFVVGDVVAPGSYQVSAAGTALTALYAAGGPTLTGSMRNIGVRRAGKNLAQLDVYDYLLRGDNSNDVRLETGDVVFVPPVGSRVALTGLVQRPAFYELRGAETLTNLIQMAGGLRPEASARRMQISRVLPPAERRAAGRERVIIDVDSATIAMGRDVPLQPHDRVSVSAVAARVRQRINVSGAVWAPAEVSFIPGMRLLDAVAAAGGLRDDAIKSEYRILRLETDERRRLIRVSAERSAEEANPILQDEDEVHVFGAAEFRASRFVTIGGAVRSAKRIAWVEGMTLRTAIMEAGGLEEWALLSSAEIARYPESRDSGKLASLIKVSLDSTYLLDRDAQGRYLGPPGLPATSGRQAEYALLPYDHVNILSQPEWVEGGSVSLSGEIRFPGSYAIANRSERLSDLVRRAGGITTRAYLLGAVLTRPVDPETRAARAKALDQVRRDRAYGIALEKLKASALLRSSDGSAAATSGVDAAGGEQVAALTAALGGGDDASERVTVDLAEVLRRPGSRTDFVLRPGDRLVIPEHRPEVSVRGMVGNPTTLSLIAGADVTYYVNKSGGTTRNGDLYRSFVIQPDGQVDAYVRHLFWPDVKPVPLAGATIVVPPRDAEVSVPNTTLPLVLSALASLATAAVAIVTLSK